MFPNLDDLLLFGVPLMPLIFGIVEFIKARGVSGSVRRLRTSTERSGKMKA